MKLLITGCAGFIGLNFTEYALNKYADLQVAGVDYMTYAANKDFLSLLPHKNRFKFYKTDICDKAEIEKIFVAERPDCVVNFAAETHVDNSITSPDIFIKTNVSGVQVLLDASVKFGVKRFHQASTDEVYGDLPVDSNLAFDETAALKPSSPYSASKAAADLLVFAYKRTYGLNVTVSRSSNNYGRFQHTEKFIPCVINSLKENKPVKIYGDGRNVRDWLNVYDNSRAIDCILNRGADGEAYNVGGKNERCNLEVVSLIAEIMGKKSVLEFVEDRKGHDRKYSLDTRKIEALGFTPRTEFYSGLSETVKFYIDK